LAQVSFRDGFNFDQRHEVLTFDQRHEVLTFDQRLESMLRGVAAAEFSKIFLCAPPAFR
jgi:hypothetical protein